MGETSAIEWTDASWTPIRARFATLDGDEPGTPRLGWHCEHASEGCRNCYAENMNRRLGTLLPYKPGHRKDIELFLDEQILIEPLRWKKPRKISVCSMTDLFADFVPDEMIDRIFAVMALCPQHTFQVLTKRSARMREYMSALVADDSFRPYVRRPGYQAPDKRDGDRVMLLDEGQSWPLTNIWLGVSVEDQRAADERIPDLLATPAAVRWLSCEPLLGPVDLTAVRSNLGGIDRPLLRMNALTGAHHCGPGAFAQDDAMIDWVVAGGESGRDARPMFLPHVQSLRDQCAGAGVPFLMKQWGEWIPAGQMAASKSPIVEFGYDYAAQHRYHRVGKKAAGRLLDGVLHDGYPVVATEQGRSLDCARDDRGFA